MKKRLFKSVLAVMLAVIMLLVFAACGDGGNTGSGGKDKKIVVLLKNVVNPFWVDVQTGAKAAGDDTDGFTVDVIAPVTADSNEEQINLIDQQLLDPPDAFVIAPADSQGIAPAIQRINEKGIPVINVNTRITGEGAKYDSFVATDNVEVGYVTMKALAEKMGGKGNVVIILGVTGQQNTSDRLEGAKKAIDEFPDIKILDEQTANWNRAESMKVMQDLLQKHADINAVFTQNAEMAIGASEAIKQAGKIGDIKIGGIDVFKEIIDKIKAGDVTLTNDGVSYQQGYQAVMAAIDVLNGKQISDRIKIETKIVDESNAGEYKFD